MSWDEWELEAHKTKTLRVTTCVSDAFSLCPPFVTSPLSQTLYLITPPYPPTRLPSDFSPFTPVPAIPIISLTCSFPSCISFPSQPLRYLSPDLLFLKIAPCFMPLRSSQLYLYLSFVWGFFLATCSGFRPASCLSHACLLCLHLDYSACLNCLTAVYHHGSVSLWTSFLWLNAVCLVFVWITCHDSLFWDLLI